MPLARLRGSLLQASWHYTVNTLLLPLLGRISYLLFAYLTYFELPSLVPTDLPLHLFHFAYFPTYLLNVLLDYALLHVLTCRASCLPTLLPTYLLTYLLTFLGTDLLAYR